MVLIQRGAWPLVGEGDKDAADVDVAEGGGEVEVRVGEAGGGSVRVVEEVGMGL